MLISYIFPSNPHWKKTALGYKQEENSNSLLGFTNKFLSIIFITFVTTANTCPGPYKCPFSPSLIPLKTSGLPCSCLCFTLIVIFLAIWRQYSWT